MSANETPPAPAEDQEIVIGVHKFRSFKVTIEEAVFNSAGEQELNSDGTPKIKRRRFLVREMDGAKRDEYLTVSQAKTHTNEHGYRITDDYTGSCSMLLGRMMYEITTQGDVTKIAPKPLDEAEIQKWPSHQQVQLFNAAVKISGLDEGAVDKAKNDLMKASAALGGN